MIDLPIDLLVAHLDAVVLIAKLILASTAIALAIATAIELICPPLADG